MKKIYYCSLIAFAGLAFFVLVLSSALPETGSISIREWVQTGALAAVSALLAGALTFLFIKLFADQ
jgi:hypothetical protein